MIEQHKDSSYQEIHEAWEELKIIFEEAERLSETGD
jgi:hypothetical protein